MSNESRRGRFVGRDQFSPEARRRQERSLDAEVQRVIGRVRQGQELVAGLEEIYDPELVKYSRAYINRNPDSGHTYLDPLNHRIKVEEIIPTFAQLIADSLNAIPAEERGQWMSDYLTNIESLRS